MFETTMKAVVLAKKLRARLATLKKDRPAKLKAYDAAVAKWKRDMVPWTKSAVETRINAITKAELQANEPRLRHEFEELVMWPDGVTRARFIVGYLTDPRKKKKT